MLLFRPFYRYFWLFLAIGLALGSIILPFSMTGAADLQENPRSRDIYLLELKGVVTAGKAAFIQRELAEINAADTQAVIISIDTPGGLLDATLDLTRAFATAPVPVVVFVHPSGAIAASAGAFILVSADIAAMAPGTTVGAAMPVAISPGGTEQADEKTVNFLAGHIKSIAREKGRPGEIVEKFVTENLTLNAYEAEEQGVIDLLSGNIDTLLEALDGREVEKEGRFYSLSSREARLVRKEMNLTEKLQDKISDPQIAFLLLAAGALGLYFGLGMPGTLVPEVLGAIALLLGIYGIGLFDTSTAGIIFIVLGLSLLVAEIFSAGFGVLGIGGGISLLLGSLLLPREPLMALEWYSAFRATAIGVALAVSAICFLIVTMLLRSRRQWKEAGDFFRPAAVATVVEELSPCGTVKMRGELWKACSHDSSTIPPGSRVEIIRQESLTLIVKKID